MVALTDLVYPHSFVNVGKPLHYWIHFKSNRNPIRITFPSAHYKDVTQIIHTLNQVVRLKRSAAEPFMKDSKVKRQVAEDEEEDILSIVEEEEEETTTQVPTVAPVTTKPETTEEDDLVDFVNEEEDTKEVVQEPPGVPKPVAPGKEGTTSGPVVPQREEIRENQQDGLAGHLDTTKSVKKETEKKTEGVEGDGGDKEKGGAGGGAPTERGGVGGASKKDSKEKPKEKGGEGGGIQAEQEKPPKKKDKETPAEKETPEEGGVTKASEPVEGGRNTAEQGPAGGVTKNTAEQGPAGGVTKNESKENPSEKESTEDVTNVSEPSGGGRNTAEQGPVGGVPKNESKEEKKPTEENKAEEDGMKPDEEDDEDLIDLVNKDEEEKEVKKEEVKKENDQTDEDSIRVVNEDLAQKEAEERARHLKEESDKLEAEQELIDIVNQEQEITEARFTYFNLAQDVLNRPYDPTTYRELLEEFEKLRSLVSIDDPSFNPREYFDFSEENGRIKVNFLHSDIRFLEFDKGCSYFLGFTDTIVRNTHVAPHKVDLFGDVSVIYLYSDVVEPIILSLAQANMVL
ncbi:hypothetical protein CAEBREN_29995 [Caenorhabditis brenneri]|uniref:Uncharacterized protein n=1 Tax=Caenorhabditis brenneri TaxID=135651 RepID=G0PAB6_CAEBE|nr:hypothetical protein CAEBREN_29995 [Caenorhabditis brenneri]